MGGLVHVALQEGFEDDPVVVCLDGDEVYRRDAVTTRMQIGLADSFELTVEHERGRLEVSLPKRNLKRATALDLADTTYVGVSVERGAIAIRSRREPFRYA